jgi:ubiquinone/menaquinone biosynthesis C-methylase UbiE
MDRKAEAEIMNLPDEVDAYVRGDFASINQLFADRLIELAGSHQSAAAIDLGTGPADIPVRVAKLRPQWSITAVDASAPMLEAAGVAIKKANVASIKLVLADAKDSKLPARSFDILFSNSILHHVSSPGGFWSEVRRIAKPDAFVLIRDLARPESEARARELVKLYAGSESTLLQQEFFNSLLSSYTTEEVRAQISNAGLGQLRVSMVSDRHLDVAGRLWD